MYVWISGQRSWFSTFTLQHSAVEELVFWHSSLGRLIGRVEFVWNLVQSELLIWMRLIPDMADILLSLGLSAGGSGVWSTDLAMENSTMREILGVRVKSCNRLRLSSQGYLFSSSRTARMLRVLLTSAVGSLMCKRRLSAFLRFAFFMEFLSNLIGCPDPKMSRWII